MRLIKHLNEIESSHKKIEDMLAILKKDCGPYLREAGHFQKGKFLYRGVRRGLRAGKTGLEKRVPRKDRIPTDITPVVHSIINDVLKDKFGWNVRREGVFTTSSFVTASEFGIPYLFFPIGKFKFVYSLNVQDLLGNLERHGILEWHDGKYFIVPSLANNKEKIKKEVEYVLKDYTDKNLARGVREGSEIVFKCKAYYLADQDDGYDIAKLIW